jgi:hypothetical protein
MLHCSVSAPQTTKAAITSLSGVISYALYGHCPKRPGVLLYFSTEETLLVNISAFRGELAWGKQGAGAGRRSDTGALAILVATKIAPCAG